MKAPLLLLRSINFPLLRHHYRLSISHNQSSSRSIVGVSLNVTVKTAVGRVAVEL